jgi:hypothetical protein
MEEGPMAERDPGRRPTGSGEDGGYIETRKPTIDDQDDVDDEDGTLTDELDEETDLTLRVDDPDDEAVADDEEDPGR